MANVKVANAYYSKNTYYVPIIGIREVYIRDVPYKNV